MLAENLTVRLDDAGDKEVLRTKAREVGLEKPSILIRALVRAVKRKSPQDIRSFLFDDEPKG